MLTQDTTHHDQSQGSVSCTDQPEMSRFTGFTIVFVSAVQSQRHPSVRWRHGRISAAACNQITLRDCESDWHPQTRMVLHSSEHSCHASCHTLGHPHPKLRPPLHNCCTLLFGQPPFIVLSPSGRPRRQASASLPPSSTASFAVHRPSRCRTGCCGVLQSHAHTHTQPIPLAPGTTGPRTLITNPNTLSSRCCRRPPYRINRTALPLPVPNHTHPTIPDSQAATVPANRAAAFARP